MRTDGGQKTPVPASASARPLASESRLPAKVLREPATTKTSASTPKSETKTTTTGGPDNNGSPDSLANGDGHEYGVKIGICVGGPDDNGSPDGLANGDGHKFGVKSGTDNDWGPDGYGSPDGLANCDGHKFGVKTGIGKLDHSLEGMSDSFADAIGGGDGRTALPFGYGNRIGDPQASTRTDE